MILTIAAKDLRSLFFSPLAWVILAVVQFLLAWYFSALVERFLNLQPRLAMIPGAPGITDFIVARLFGYAAILWLLVTPLITMRSLSEERRNGTLGLLTSAPITSAQIVLGKYLSLVVFFLVTLGITCLMPLSLLVGGSLDWLKFASSALGIALLLCTFAAAGLFMSSLTNEPIIAAVSTFGLLLLFWIIDVAAGMSGSPEGVLSYLSLREHFGDFQQGLFKTDNLIYYLISIALLLTLTVRKLDAERN